VQRVGVLGLGRMGLPIAQRLIESGHLVSAYDPRDDRLTLACSAGARAATNEQDLARQVEILVTVLPGPTELRDAMLGPGAALEGLAPGSCWLDLTSNDPRVATDVARVAADRGVDSVGAPMGGGPVDAAAGTLTFWIGGNPAAVDRVMPLLSVLGDRHSFVHMGDDIAAGFTTKLLANTLWFGQVIAVTEALLLGQALGLGVEALRNALAEGPGGSVFITKHLDSLLEGDYLTSFGLPRVVEELETVTSLAEAAGTPVDLTRLVADLHREALARFGPVDGELMAARLLEERAGATLRRSV